MAKKENNNGMAAIAYVLFFVPLLTDSKKDPYVMFHVKQGLVVFAIGVVLSIIRMITPWGLYLFGIGGIFYIIYLGLTILAIIGIMNALNGKKEPLPLIGQFADKIKL